MSIADQITRIKNNIAASYAECSAKGATLPATENSENLPNTIASITTGGGSGGGEEITAYNYTSKALTQGDWVHYNERVDNTAQVATYNINGLAYCYCVAPDILLYSSGAYNPNIIFTATLNESNNTYIDSQVGSIEGYPRRFCGIDKDGYLYSNHISGFSSLNYERGYYWGNGECGITSEFYLDSNSHSIVKIDKTTGNILKTYTDKSQLISYATGGYQVSDDILIVCSKNNKTIYKCVLNDESLDYTQTSTNIRCGCIIGGLSNSIILGLTYDENIASTLLAFKYENGALITYSKENFPSVMQECFDTNCTPFWNEQYGIFTAYIPSNGKCVCCQYINGVWIDRSPILDVSGLSIDTQSQFMVSSDFSRAFLLESGSTYLQFAITSASDGNYLVPYSYTNSATKMGKVKENVDAAIGTQCTVVIPKVETSSSPKPAEKGYLWTQENMIVDIQFLDTQSEIYDSNKDSGATNYVAVNYNLGGKPLIYRRSNGLVYSFDGLDDNDNLIWQQKFDWGQVSNLKTASYQDSNGYDKIVAINSGDSDTSIEWTILVQIIGGEVKKSKISKNLCFVTAGFTADGVPLLCACSETTLYHFLISTDEGDTWKEISLPVSNYEYIHNVLISKGSIFVVMGTYSDIILKSSNCGDTWETVNLGDYVGDNTSRAVIQDGYNEYILFPCSSYSEGYLWNGSEYKKVTIPNNIGMPNQTDFAISAPCAYGAIMSRARNSKAFVVQLEDDGLHIKKTFDYSAVNNAGVAPIIAKDKEHLCSLNYSNKRFAIFDYIFRIAYTKKEIPEVGDQASTIDKMFNYTVTNYSNGVMNISIYDDTVPLIREPRGDITLG
nr:MAG TPA: Photosynthesis system II assembly factor YCF48 [Caudoviricetes sp.]